MSSHHPRVSIGMPVFNGENFLAAAFASLLQQTFSDFELIVSDNCSTDGTEEICRRYAAQDDRIRYVRQEENIGAVINFNRVFELARGEYFKWAAHDDVCAPTFLQTCVDILDNDPQVVWCHTSSDMIDSAGRSWVTQLPEHAEELERLPDGSMWWKGFPRQHDDSDRPHRRYAGVLLGTNWCVDSYGLIRAAALRKTPMLKTIYGSEKVLIGALSLQGKFKLAPERLFAQRVHAAASSSLATGAEQQLYVAPSRNHSFLKTRWALVRAHWETVGQSDLSSFERLRCRLVVLRYVLQFHKWHRIISAMVRGTGTGGGGRQMLEARRHTTKRVSMVNES